MERQRQKQKMRQTHRQTGESTDRETRRPEDRDREGGNDDGGLTVTGLAGGRRKTYVSLTHPNLRRQWWWGRGLGEEWGRSGWGGGGTQDF